MIHEAVGGERSGVLAPLQWPGDSRVKQPGCKGRARGGRFTRALLPALGSCCEYVSYSRNCLKGVV